MTVSGHGYGKMNINFRYNIPARPDKKCLFDITVEVPSDVRPHQENFIDENEYVFLMQWLQMKTDFS